MPIEVYPGRSGPRLIARMPVQNGSYALICYTDGEDTVELTASYQGGTSSGYPVLSPVLDTLAPWIAKQITDERSVLTHNTSRFLDEDKYPLPEYAATHAAARGLLEALDAFVPILSSIKVGTVLSVIAPALLPTRVYHLGPVTGWEIFNI